MDDNRRRATYQRSGLIDEVALAVRLARLSRPDHGVTVTNRSTPSWGRTRGEGSEEDNPALTRHEILKTEWRSRRWLNRTRNWRVSCAETWRHY